MNNLIIPVGGLSSRYQDTRPKWLLTHPNGNFMFIEAIKGLNLSYFNKIFLVAVKDTLDKYNCQAGIVKQMKTLSRIKYFKLIVLDTQTRNQPETVFQGIVKGNITGSLCIKDCDNYFKFSANGKNFISYTDLDDTSNVNASNKSYVMKNKEDQIINIVEKQVISKHFCSGCYGFEDVNAYKKYYELLKNEDNLYISHIIYKMLLDKHKFSAIKCHDYVDWGTLRDWLQYTKKYSTLFVDIDGVIVENSAEYFKPSWGETGPILKNVEYLNKLYDTGLVQIILVTTRKKYSDNITKKQLKKIGLKYHDIMYGLLHAKRILINDYSNTNPFRSCDAINIKRNSNELSDMLLPLLNN